METMKQFYNYLFYFLRRMEILLEYEEKIETKKSFVLVITIYIVRFIFLLFNF